MQLLRFLLLLLATLIVASNATQEDQRVTYGHGDDDESNNLRKHEIEERGGFSWVTKLIGKNTALSRNTGLGKTISNLRDNPNVVAVMEVPVVKQMGVAIAKDEDFLLKAKNLDKWATKPGMAKATAQLEKADVKITKADIATAANKDPAKARGLLAFLKRNKRWGVLVAFLMVSGVAAGLIGALANQKADGSYP